MSIVTVVMSLAVPVNDGVRSFEGEGGRFSVTVGEAVSTSNVTGLLMSVVLPLKDGVELFVVVPSGGLSITGDADAAPTGPASTRTASTATTTPIRPLRVVHRDAASKTVAPIRVALRLAAPAASHPGRLRCRRPP